MANGARREIDGGDGGIVAIDCYGGIETCRHGEGVIKRISAATTPASRHLGIAPPLLLPGRHGCSSGIISSGGRRSA